MEDSCRLCRRRREEGSEYCVYHQQAFRNLEEAYSSWRRALNLGWEDFLKVVSEEQGTGRWACEVAVSLLNQDV